MWADHDRLEQVFVNLLDNALRHNPPGVEVKVEVALSGPDAVVVRVADNGKGIVYQDPAVPVQSNASQVRIMDPNTRYPEGYARAYNEFGQPMGYAEG